MVDVAKLQVVVDADTTPAEQGLSAFGTKLGGVGNMMGLAFGTAALAGVTALAGGIAGAVSTAADFEKTMSGVKAVMSPDDVNQFGGALQDLALRLGKDTAFSASEAAKGIEELTKGGLSASDILNGAAEATLNLAAAGGVSLPDAATIAANALAQFNLKGDDMAHVADLIAGAANASALDVSDFKFSLSAAGAVASTVGFSFDDLAQAIAVMGKAGITGSDAGTSLKTMMMRLIPSTNDARDTMRQLGIVTGDIGPVLEKMREGLSQTEAGQKKLAELTKSGLIDNEKELFNALNKVNPKFLEGAESATDFGIKTGMLGNQFFDAQGKVKSMAQVADVLQGALAGMNEEQKLATMQTLFGSDAIRAAAVLAKEGAAGFEDMAQSMGKVSAEAVGAARLDNMNGAMEQLGGSVETLAITVGMQLLPGLTALVKGATTVINALIPIAERVLPQIIDGIQDGFAPVIAWFQDNWPLIQKTFEVVVAAIERFWAVHGKNIIAIITDVWTIVSTIIKTALANVADTIKIAMQLITGDWSGAWDTLLGMLKRTWAAYGTIIGAALDAIVALIDIETGGAVTAIKDWLADTQDFVTKGWAGIVLATSDAWDAIVSLTDTAWSGASGVVATIGDAASSAMTKAKAVGTAAMNGLQTGLTSIWTSTVKPWLDDLASLMIAAVKAFDGGPAKWLWDIGALFLAGLKGGWDAYWNGTLSAYLSGIASTMIDLIVAYGGGPARWLYDAGVQWLSGLKAGWDAYWTGGGFGSWLGSAAETMVKMITDWGGGPAQWLYDTGVQWLSGLKAGWDAYWTGGFGSWLGTAAEVMVGMIVDWGGGPAQWLYAAGSQWLSGLKAGWDDFWTGGFGAWLGGAAEAMVGVIVAWGGGPAQWLYAAGSQWLSGLKAGWDDFWSGGFGSWLGSAAETMVKMITDWGGGPGKWLYQAGSDLIAGFQAGIDSAIGGLKSWIEQNLTSALPEWVRTALGIKSPSTVFAEIGSQLVAGLIEGLKSRTSDLLKAATDMATKLVGSFDTVGEMGGLDEVLRAALSYTGKPESWLSGLEWIVAHESGGKAGAKNPDSTASGLFQLIDSTWAAYRDKSLPNDVFNPMANAVAGIKYIDDRYGNPDKAVDFWKSHNYYGDGGIAWSPQMAHVAENGPEAIIPLGRLGGIGAATTIQIVVQGSLVAQHELEAVVADAWRRAARSGRL